MELGSHRFKLPEEVETPPPAPHMRPRIAHAGEEAAPAAPSGTGTLSPGTGAFTSEPRTPPSGTGADGRHGCGGLLGGPWRVSPPPHLSPWGCAQAPNAAVGARAALLSGVLRGIIPASPWPGPPAHHGPWLPQNPEPSFVFSLGCWGHQETPVCL